MDTDMSVFTSPPITNIKQHTNVKTTAMQQHLIEKQQQKLKTNYKKAQIVASQNQSTIEYKPLTPPGLPEDVLPTTLLLLENSNKSALTPCNRSPMAITPLKSPIQTNVVSEQDHDLMSNCSEDLKYSYCKMTKNDYQKYKERVKNYTKPKKMFQCPKCSFVTALKHHMDYHMNKHENRKPFQCDECSYSCISKSALNSHSKLHSTVYQYRCANCNYVSKYLHTLKQHLRRYDHKPGTVLDKDGNPDASIKIEANCNRRAVKNKFSSRSFIKKSNADFNMTPAIPSFAKDYIPVPPAINNSSLDGHTQAAIMQQQQQLFASSLMLPSQITTPNDNNTNILSPLALIQLNLQMQAALMTQLFTYIREQNNEENHELKELRNNSLNNDKQVETCNEHDKVKIKEEIDDDGKTNSSYGITTKTKLQIKISDVVNNLKNAKDNVETPRYSATRKNRRKGQAIKFVQDQASADIEMNISPSSIIASSTPNNTPSEHSSVDSSNSSPSGNSSGSSFTTDNSNISTDNSNPVDAPNIFECKYCEIYFKDQALYAKHMDYHSDDDAFKCNKCGERCDGPIGLFDHIARFPHS